MSGPQRVAAIGRNDRRPHASRVPHHTSSRRRYLVSLCAVYKLPNPAGPAPSLAKMLETSNHAGWTAQVSLCRVEWFRLLRLNVDSWGAARNERRAIEWGIATVEGRSRAASDTFYSRAFAINSSNQFSTTMSLSGVPVPLLRIIKKRLSSAATAYCGKN
jgi:hypothetical protein